MALPHPRLRRIGLLAYLMLTAVVVGGLAAVLTGANIDGDTAGSTTALASEVLDGAVVGEGGLAEPTPTTPDRVDDASEADLAFTEPGLATQAIVATVTTEGVYAYARPDGQTPLQWFPNPTQFGGDRVFLVTDADSDTDWVEVSMPVMPNGQTGWIERRFVELSNVEHRVEVDLSERSVRLWRGDTEVLSTTAVIGTDQTPTPLGRFYIRDVIEQADPTGVYGSHIVALSGFSEVMDTFNGGLPAIAIHGTNNPSLIGEQRSKGCVRITNDQIAALAEIPLGTPVDIVG